MDRARYAVDAVVIEGRSLRSVASSLEMSKSWVAKQVGLFRAGGYEALVLKSTAPHRRPTQLDVAVENEIVMLRKQLSEDGFDAGPLTIQYHLRQRHGTAPARSTIHRALVRRGFVVPQPQKRPRHSWVRFEASLPNETWQADMTHWALADGTGVEILDFVDDYSRMGRGGGVLRNGRCGFETELTTLGITIKHGKPYHPQTQGKIERFHQTLKRWLRKQDPAASIAELQGQVDVFVRYYNEIRPHSARGMVPPKQAFDALVKAAPDPDKYPMTPHTRVRHDKIDKTGVFTLRYGTQLHHVGVGRAHTGRRVIVLVADLDIRVLSEEGELLRHLTLDPEKDYQALAPKAEVT
jgi:transposase